MVEYNTYHAKTSDGKKDRCFRSPVQAKSFFLDWLVGPDDHGNIVPKKDGEGKNLTVTLTHEIEEIHEEEEARKRGLTPCSLDRITRQPLPCNAPLVFAARLIQGQPGKYELVDVTKREEKPKK